MDKHGLFSWSSLQVKRYSLDYLRCKVHAAGYPSVSVPGALMCARALETPGNPLLDFRSEKINEGKDLGRRRIIKSPKPRAQIKVSSGVLQIGSGRFLFL